MNRRSILLALFGGAVAALSPIVAVAGESCKAKIEYAVIRTRLPAEADVLRGMAQQGGVRSPVQSTPDDTVMLALEAGGCLKRAYQDHSGIYWLLTPSGRKLGKGFARIAPRGDISSRVKMHIRSAI